MCATSSALISPLTMAHRCLQLRKDDQIYICPLKISADNGCDVGLLLGISFATTFMPDARDEMAVVGCCACTSYTDDSHPPDWQREAEFVAAHYPPGVCACGIFLRNTVVGEDADHHKVKDLCKHLLDKKSQYKESQELILESSQDSESYQRRFRIVDPLTLFTTDRVLVVVLGAPEKDSAEHDIRQCYLYNTVAYKVLSISPIIVTGLSQWCEDKSVILRLQASFNLEVTVSDDVRVKVKECFKKKQKELLSPLVTLHIPSFGITVGPKSYIGSDRMLRTVADLWELPRMNTDKAKLKLLSAEVLDLELLFSTDDAGPCDGPVTLPAAPVVTYQPSSVEYYNIPVPIDVMCMLSLTTPFQSVYDIICEGISLQLEQIEKYVLWKEGQLHTVCVNHFVLPNHHCPVTMVYPCKPFTGDALKDSDLVEIRQSLHANFMLPNNRPYLRHANRITSRNKRAGHLINVHNDVKPHGVKDSSVAMVEGTYSYYHYMQDGTDDKGWGCAYRSLQTLWSWYHHQGYTSKHVPNHRAIQQALVDTGDKPPSLVGSKQWIGSFEVNIVLSHLIGVTSKILHVPSGAEMDSQGRQLLLHFRTQGTPIMIGGGVLAHTILGVCYNEQTGDIKFLVLDPHYTGKDDINVIINKGWCGWKKADFWDQEAHYNLCMPQLMDEI